MNEAPSWGELAYRVRMLVRVARRTDAPPTRSPLTRPVRPVQRCVVCREPYSKCGLAPVIGVRNVPKDGLGCGNTKCWAYCRDPEHLDKKTPANFAT